MKIIKIFICFLFFAAAQSNAATISFERPASAILVGETFTLDVMGSDFLNSADGGGFNLSFDSSILNIISVSIDESVWDFGGFGISGGDVNNNTGLLSGVIVNTFSSPGNFFVVATIEFEAIGLGFSDLILSSFSLNPWAVDGALIDPIFQATSLEVTAVPLPASVWLMLTGIFSLWGFAKNNKISKN